jgi:hypothetical protein
MRSAHHAANFGQLGQFANEVFDLAGLLVDLDSATPTRNRRASWDPCLEIFQLTLCAAQGQVEVTPESMQLPAVQQTPAEQELLPAQRASQLVPPQ